MAGTEFTVAGVKFREVEADDDKPNPFGVRLFIDERDDDKEEEE